jgi:hypothetical protein
MPNMPALEAAERVVADVITDFVAMKHRGLVLKAPAGAGKTGAVCAAAQAAAQRGLRVLVTGQTNAQVQDLVRRTAAAGAKVRIAYLHAAQLSVPDDIRALPTVTATTNALQTHGVPVVIATAAKLAYAAEDLGGFEVGIVDEAYQCDSTSLYCIAGLSRSWLLVGDPGQLDPFSTVDTSRWRGLPEDPTLTAVDVLLRNHPETMVRPFPVSRRLSPSAVDVVASFYPELRFDAATLPDERELRLGTGPRFGEAAERLADAGLDMATREGWGHIELPARRTLSADHEAASTIVEVVARLFARRAQVRCERWPRLAALKPERVAIGVSHRDQRDLVLGLLQSRGLDGVQVDTANSLQGLEFDVTVVWHPLTGQFEADSFHLDPGRMCVLLSRHRQACIVVGRASDQDLLRHQPPMTERWIGFDVDPVTDGWEAHSEVLKALERCRVA